jgi:hypothetical protein
MPKSISSFVAWHYHNFPYAIAGNEGVYKSMLIPDKKFNSGAINMMRPR